MSAGTPVTSIRLPRALHALIEAYLERRNALALVDPWTMTDWIVAASRELLRKKAWRRGKAQVIHTEVESHEELLIESSLLANETVGLTSGEGI